jgi:sugar/nucleoside kinase (ribokinase family)
MIDIITPLDLCVDFLVDLGLKTTGKGKVGDDILGSFVLEKLKNTGVCCDFISFDKTVNTGAGIALCKSNDRAFHTYYGSIDTLTETDFSDSIIEKSLKSCIISVCRYCLLFY